MATLPLSDIVKVDVNLSPKSAVRKGFNVGLIIGNSDVITPDERIKIFAGIDAVADAGFTEDTPEYKAAVLYFSQPKPPTRLAIGRYVKTDGLRELTVTTEEGTEEGKYKVVIDEELTEGYTLLYKTAVSSIAIPEYNKELTTGWTPIISGEEIEATKGHLIMIAEVDTDNKVKRVGKAKIGGESIPLNLPENETITEALRACRTKNTSWYPVMLCNATSEEILDIAAYVQTASPSTVQFYTTTDLEVFEKLKALNYRRSLGQCSKTENAAAGVMGYAMGANTKTARSAYTLMHKTIVGLEPDEFDVETVETLTKLNANYYISRGEDGDYTMFENGVLADGTWFDEILNLDMLVNDLQLSTMDLLKSRPKVAQEESGVNSIKLAITPCLKLMRKIGFIAPGVWNGPDIYLTEDYLALETGDMLNDGYIILSEPVDEQSQADRDARKAPNIYIPIKLAGAIHTVLLQVDVNR